MLIKILTLVVILTNVPIAQANELLAAYNNAGSVCKTSAIESLLQDHSSWLDQPDEVPDIRPRFAALISGGCEDGLMMLLYSKTQLNAGKYLRYYDRCEEVWPILNKSVSDLKKRYPHYLFDAYRLLGVCSAVTRRSVSDTIVWYTLALSESPESIEVQLSLASLYADDRQAERSKRLVLTLLEKGLPEPSQREAYSILGKNYFLDKNPRRAVYFFKKTEALNLKLMNISSPFNLLNLAKAFDKFDPVEGQLYWNKLRKLKDNPSRRFQLSDADEKLLSEKTMGKQ